MVTVPIGVVRTVLEDLSEVDREILLQIRPENNAGIHPSPEQEDDRHNDLSKFKGSHCFVCGVTTHL